MVNACDICEVSAACADWQEGHGEKPVNYLCACGYRNSEEYFTVLGIKGE